MLTAQLIVACDVCGRHETATGIEELGERVKGWVFQDTTWPEVVDRLTDDPLGDHLVLCYCPACDPIVCEGCGVEYVCAGFPYLPNDWIVIYPDDGSCSEEPMAYCPECSPEED